MPDIGFPPAEWNSFSVSQQEAKPNILTQGEFDRAHILAPKQSFNAEYLLFFKTVT